MDFIKMFNELPTWEERYEYLIEKCTTMEMPEELRTEENRIKSCISKLYFYVDRQPAVKIYAWGNSPISLGLAGILAEMFEGREIIPAYSHINFQKKTGLIDNLTPARAAALDEMIRILTSA